MSNKGNKLLAKIRNGEQMTDGDKLRLIMQLSIPSILSQVSSILMSYIDAAMVGSLGAKASAAIGLVQSTTWLFGGIANAAIMGFSVQAAHFIGANDLKKVRLVFRLGLMTLAIMAMVLTLVCVCIANPLPYWLGGGTDIAPLSTSYFLIYCISLPVYMIGMMASAMLKSSGNMKIPSMMSIAMCAFDIVFNFIAIFPSRNIEVMGMTVHVPGLNMGVAGAAFGTAIAFLITGTILVWIATRNALMISLKGEKWIWRPCRGFMRNAMRISSPMALQYILMSGAQIVSTMIVAPLGNFAIAANTFAITAESLCYMPGLGIGEAATTLVGQSIGANRRDLTKSFAYMTIGMGMLVMAVMGAVMYIFAPEMIGIMTPVKEITVLGVGALRIEAFAEPMFAAAIIGNCICIGAGDTKIPSIMNLGSMWLVRLSFAAYLAPRYGLAGVWFAMATELIFRGTIFLIRIYKSKWMFRNVTSA